MVKRLPGAGLAILLLAGGSSRSEPPATTQWVLATAKATGRGGEEFVSALRVFNPSGSSARVDLTYLAQSPLDATFAAGGDNRAAPKATLSVAPGETIALEDVLGTLFAGKEAPFGIPAGGIRVESDVPVSVLSRTFVANARSASGVPGTQGFAIPAQTAAQAVRAGEAAWLTFVSTSPSAESGFRTNLILLNTGETPAVANVALVRGDGSLAGERDYTLAPAASAQQTDVGASFGVAGTGTNFRLAVRVRSGGPVAIGASLIDNAISSISYLPPAKADLPDDGAYGWVATSGDPALASSGRLDVVGGAPNFLSGLFVVGCPAGSFLQNVLAWGAGSGVPTPNTTFSAGAAGEWTFVGSSADAGSWSGTIRAEVDGSLSGTLTFTTPSNARCASVTTTYGLAAALAVRFEGAP